MGRIAVALLAVALLGACGALPATPTVNAGPTQTAGALGAQVGTLTAQNAALQGTINAPTPTRAATSAPPPTATPVIPPTPTTAPSPTRPAATATPTPGKIALTAQNASCYKDTASTIWCIGEVANTGQAEAAEVTIAVSLIDAGGQTVATGSSGGIFATVPILRPGEKIVYRALMNGKPTEWKEERVQAQGQPVSASTRGLAYLDVRTEGVTLAPPASQFGAVVVTGQVVNTGSGTAKSVRVTAGVYDDGGKLVGVADSYVKLDQIPPGGSAPFSIDFSNLKQVYPKVDLYISAQVVR